MEITTQEKINLSYLFISAYENIVNLIKPIHNSINDLLKGATIDDSEIILSMYKIFKEKFTNKKTLKIKNTHRLLVEIGIFSKEDLKILIMLSKIRSEIGHENLNIYFNKNINFEYFKIENLLKLYKKLFERFSKISIKKDAVELNKILNENKLNYELLIKLINELFKDLKFENIKTILN